MKNRAQRVSSEIWEVDGDYATGNQTALLEAGYQAARPRSPFEVVNMHVDQSEIEGGDLIVRVHQEGGPMAFDDRPHQGGGVYSIVAGLASMTGGDDAMAQVIANHAHIPLGFVLGSDPDGSPAHHSLITNTDEPIRVEVLRPVCTGCTDGT
jgi:hypothetical protein